MDVGKYKNILLIGAEVKPIPSVKGGAVELLVDDILRENENTKFANITVVSPFDSNAQSQSSTYSNSSFIYIDCNRTIQIIHNIIDLFSRKFFKKSTGNYYIKKILKIIDFSKYDEIIIENRPLFGIKLRKKYKGKLILHLHNDFINKNSQQAKEILDSYDNIIVISNYLKNRILEVQPHNIEVVYNGINLNNFLSLKTYSNGKKRIIYSGRLVPEKGVLELIEAFNKINDDDIQLDIIGDFDSNAEDENKFIEKFYNLIGNNANINYIGFIQHSDIYKYYEEAYIGVVPSIVNEALSLTAIEMLAAGIPVICTNSGGLTEVVDQSNGIIISKNNLSDNIYSSIKELINNQNERDFLSSNTRSKALFFDLNNYLHNIINYII